MIKAEYLRCLNSNYERIRLDRLPQEQRYQYCVVSRGGIRGLLPCSLRYINGDAFLYYDISSRQNLLQTCGRTSLNREWIREFFWNMRQLREELSRFLLEDQHVLWFPEHIFRDLENKDFSFLYVPYYEGDNGFGMLLEFMVEHLDYDDEALVECVYRMYEKFEECGWDYLQRQIFRDVEKLEKSKAPEASEERHSEEIEFVETLEKEESNAAAKKGFMSPRQGRRKKDRELRQNYQNIMESRMAGCAVAEDLSYQEKEWGRTVFVETSQEEENEKKHFLYTREGRMLTEIDKDFLVLGKKKEEADVVLEDPSVSRMHARISKEKDGVYLEDLNSTNGTYKNGMPLLPYEKRKLEMGDEIKIGKTELLYR